MVGRKKGSPALTPLELQIMQVLWQSGPSNVQSVQEKLAGDKLAYTTIQTMLNVLNRKSKVKRILDGRAYLYTPVVSKEKALSHAARDLVDRMFGGSAEDLVMSLVKTRQITPDQIAKLSRRIAEMKEDSGHE